LRALSEAAEYNIKKTIKLRLQQADLKAAMRSRPRCRQSQETLPGPAELKKRIAAMVLVHQRGWSAAEIAAQFSWKLQDVDRWIAAGQPLL
jgi:hypothetical protein